MKKLLLFTGLFLCIQTIRSQTSYTWNGSISTAWSTPGNWTPNGIPGAADNIKIVTASHSCVLDSDTAVSNITLTSGTFDLGGFTLTANGATALFSTGTVQNGTILISGAATTSFGNGPVIMSCLVNITSASVTLKNTLFQDSTTITKTGTSNDASGGNNVFNGPLTMTNAGAGYLVMGNGFPDQYMADATFNNTGANNIYVAYNSSNNIFGGITTFNNAPTANTLIYVSQNSAGTVFNGDIIVSSTSGQGIQFDGGAAAASSLAAGKHLAIGAAGFSTGTLLLRQFTQVGATAQNLSLTGAGNLTLGPSASFDGDLTLSSPTLLLNGATFNGATNFTKTGTTGDWSAGNNIFNGVCAITNSGSSYLVLGNSGPDTWNNDVTFTDNGSERLLPCWASAGNHFYGNIYVNTSGSAGGIQFCGGNTTATATLAAGKTIQAGVVGLTAGFLYLKQFTQAGSTPINITATGTSVLYVGPGSNFGGSFTATAPDIWAQGATYNGPAVFTKTGGASNHNNQYQNIFNSTCAINQQSNTGYFMLGYNSNDLFRDDITVTSTGTGGINLGWNSGTGTPTLSAGKTLLVGAAGFSAGALNLNTFTQLGNAPVNLTFTGTNSSVSFARNSVIGGDLTTSTPDIYFNGATFDGIVNVTKTGAGNDAGAGGNTFQGSAVITNTGAGNLLFGNGTADTWNGDITFSSTGSSYIGPAWNSVGNLFNGNITVSSTGSSTGIQFCSTAASTATLAAGHAIQTGVAGFSSGALYLRRFTQLGNEASNLTLTGATTLIQVGPSAAIGGPFTAVSPRILLNGAIYSDVVSLTKTGVTGEWSTGGNTFNSTLTVNQLGGGYFGFANGAPDIYNGDVYANNNSTERIIFGNTPTGNQFNGNIILTQTGSSVGIAFGWSAATDETLAAGKTISIGAAGYSTGYLQIERFTQAGNTPMNLPLTGNSSLIFGPTSTIGGNLTSTSGSLYFNGCTFNGTVNAIKTGSTNDNSSGNNVFNDITNLTNAGAGYLMLGNGNRDQFMSAATFNNTGSSAIYVANNSPGNIFNGVTTFNNTPSANTGIYVSPGSAGTVFNDNIVVSSTNGQGVQFCSGNTTASASLAAGKTISVGAGGFSAGTLLLRQFTQTGATTQSLFLTGTGSLVFGPSSAFGGDISTVSASLYFNGCTFSGAVNSTKTGASSDQSQGNNVFNGPGIFTDNGTGYLLMTITTPDVYNGDVTFIQSSTGAVYPNYNGNSRYAGNLTVGSPAATAITFGAGNGTATLSGSGGQTINATGSTPAPVFTRLVVDNGSGVTLNTPVNVSAALSLTTGLLNTTTTNILTMLNGSSTAAGDALSTSYINGPMRYKKASAGVSTLNFPIGNGADCRPVILTVNHTSGNSYTYQAQLFDASAAALGYTLPPSVDVVSSIHYYTISRVNAASVSQPTAELSGNQTIQVFFGANDVATDGSTLTVVKNTYLNPTKWIDIGGVGGPIYNAGANLTGSITSTSSPTAFNSFSTFALGNKIGGSNILPVGLLTFTAKADNNRVDLGWTTLTESNNSYFTVEKSRDGANYGFVLTVPSAALGGNSSTSLTYAAQDPAPYDGISYYRLRQTDLDGQSTYSAVAPVSFTRKKSVSAYPNPSRGTLYISGVDIGETSLKVEWFDLSGRSISQAIVPVQGGLATLNAPFNNGVYCLRFTTSDGSMHLQNVVIMK